MDISNTDSAVLVELDKNKLKESKEKLNLVLFSAGKLVSLLGTYMYSFAISLYILKVTGSGVSFAFSIFIGTIPRVLLSPLACSISDRVDKRRMIVALDFLSGIVLIGLFALCMVWGIKLPFIYATSFILSVISTLFNNCFNSAIPSLVTDKSLMKINAYSRSIDSASQITGPVLGGMVFGLIPLELFFIMNGISFVLSAISEMFIDFRLNEEETGKARNKSMLSIRAVWDDILEVIAYIKSNKVLYIVMPFSLSCNFFMGACFSVALPYAINNVLGMSSAQFGFIQGSLPVGMLVASLIISRLPEKEKKLKGFLVGALGMGATSMALAIPLLGLTASFGIGSAFIFYMAILFVFAVFLIILDMPFAVVMQRAIPRDMLGRVIGVVGTISAGLVPLGILLAGILVDIIPSYIVFLATGIYFVAAAIIMYNIKAMQEY